jgi:hypothetical protein
LIDDIVLRQRIEKQLNKIEATNKFSKAVFFGNSSEFTCSYSRRAKYRQQLKTTYLKCNHTLELYVHHKKTATSSKSKREKRIYRLIALDEMKGYRY